jgi:hypothetical protein
MIAVRPGRRAYDVLRLIVDSPGEHTAATLVDALDPAPRRTVPFTRDDPPSRWAAMVAEHRRASCARMARLLGKLVEQGLIAKVMPPRLSPEFLAMAAIGGAERALFHAHPAFPARPKDLLHGHLEMVRQVEELPGSARDLLGARPSGARQRVYRELIGWGVVVAPQQRWPTEAGVALIRGGA